MLGQPPSAASISIGAYLRMRYCRPLAFPRRGVVCFEACHNNNPRHCAAWLYYLRCTVHVLLPLLWHLCVAHALDDLLPPFSVSLPGTLPGCCRGDALDDDALALHKAWGPCAAASRGPRDQGLAAWVRSCRPGLKRTTKLRGTPRDVFKHEGVTHNGLSKSLALGLSFSRLFDSHRSARSFAIIDSRPTIYCHTQHFSHP